MAREELSDNRPFLSEQISVAETPGRILCLVLELLLYHSFFIAHSAHTPLGPIHPGHARPGPATGRPPCPAHQHLPNTPNKPNIPNIPLSHILCGVTNLSMCCLSSSTLLLALPSKGSPVPCRHHLLLVPVPGIGIFPLSIGFCTFPELPAPCLWMGSHLCHSTGMRGCSSGEF